MVVFIIYCHVELNFPESTNPDSLDGFGCSYVASSSSLGVILLMDLLMSLPTERLTSRPAISVVHFVGTAEKKIGLFCFFREKTFQSPGKNDN